MSAELYTLERQWGSGKVWVLVARDTLAGCCRAMAWRNKRSKHVYRILDAEGKEVPLLANDLMRCATEQAEAAELLRAGHADERGLKQCINDNIAEEAILRQERGE